MPSDSNIAPFVRVRVWPSGAPGVVFALAEGHLEGVEDAPLPDNFVCDPAIPKSLLGPEAMRGQRDLTRFLARAFGLKSPLFRSLFVFRHTLDQVITARAVDPLILDVGCGSPDSPKSRASGDGRTVGLDIWQAPEHARDSMYREIMPDGTFPVEDAEFDVVRGLFVLEHVADLSFFLREASRALRPGGLAAMVTTHCPADAKPCAVGLSLGHFRDFTSLYRNGAAWLVTIEALRARFGDVGLEVESIRGSRVIQPGGSLVWCELCEGRPSAAEQLWIQARRRDAT